MTKSDQSYIFIDRKFNHLELSLSCTISQDNDWYFAECPELQMIDQGKNQNEARENLSKMIVASLLDAVGSKKIEQMLMAYGFERGDLNIPNRIYYVHPIEKKDDSIDLSLEISLPVSSEIAASN